MIPALLSMNSQESHLYDVRADSESEGTYSEAAIGCQYNGPCN